MKIVSYKRQKSKLKILHRNICLSKKEVFRKLPHKTGWTDRSWLSKWLSERTMQYTHVQCLRQDLENWVPKIGSCKIFGSPNF